MMKTPSASSVVSFQSPKQQPRQHKNRDVSSRFLPSSPTTTTTTTTSVEHSFSSSPREVLSPIRRKTGSSSTRLSKNAEEQGSTTRHHQLWPSSAKRNSGTLADRISEDRIIENLEHDTEIDSKKPNKESSVFSSRTKSKNSTPENGSNNGYGKRHRSIVPGRLSLDENALHRKLSSGRNSFSSVNSVDSESDYSEASSALNSRKKGIEVPSKYMSDGMKTRSRRGTSESNIEDIMNSDDSSSLLKKLHLQTPIKRANSLTAGYKSSKSQWALSPGRTSSPSMSVESMDKPLSFSSLKPQQSSPSPTMTRGVERFFSKGFDLFKSKKSLLNPSSPMGSGGNYEAVHQLCLLENRLMQWRYVNARAKVVNENISNQAQSNLLCAWDGVTKLQHSVLKKMIQFRRQKLEMKLNFILYSQMKLLEIWGGLERQHSSAVTKIKESLYSVICRIPLLEGAKVDLQSTSIALRHATDVTASINSMLTCFPSSVDETALLLSELAKVVAQEKQLIEEFYDLFQPISVFEIQERSAKCNLIQLESWQWKHQKDNYCTRSHHRTLGY